MASLHELLTEGGKLGKNPKSLKLKFKDRSTAEERAKLPVYICYNRKSSDFSAEKGVSRNGSSVISSRKVGSAGSVTGRSKLKTARQGDEPTEADEAAVKAVVAILSGYIGKYIKDENFRELIRGKCKSCFLRRKTESDDGNLGNLEMGIQSIDKLVENPGTKMEIRMKSMKNSNQLLSIVASLNSKKTRSNSISGVPNPHLSAIAQLYLSILYKLEKNDRICSRHLLQVFCDSPFLARTHLLPDLWEHLLLPHLLHLKVWHQKEVEFVSSSGYGDKEKSLKSLSKVYNAHMDMGTVKFALYYKQWLKTGAETPTMPDVPLPSKSMYESSRRGSLDSYTSKSSINQDLYQAVFGNMDFDGPKRTPVNAWGLEEDRNSYNAFDHAHSKRMILPTRASSHRNQRNKVLSEVQKSDHVRFFPCRNVPTECVLSSSHIVRSNSIRGEENTHLPSSDLNRAISTICSSDSIQECENAIRVVSMAWLDSHGDPSLEAALSKAPVVEGMVDLLLVSNDDEVLELAISVLAEFAVRNEVNRQIILNLDPQLETFLRLLKNSTLFLKAAVLLYLIKPMAKQMISREWIPLVLRVLEFGEQMQTLMTVRCSPKVAAFYFLDQLLTGFNEDRNFENASQVVSLGGLDLLVRSFEVGEGCDRINAAFIMSCCIQADGSCRNFLAFNLNKTSLLELIVLENHHSSKRRGFALLAELLCLKRRTQIARFLDELQNGCNGLNAMQLFFVYLQKASPEERPLVAAILLQLDLLGDPMRYSVYREEAVDAIVDSLDCQKLSKEVQEQSARALMMLGGRFSYTGEATTEKWLLQKAGFHDSFDDDKEIVHHIFSEEEEAIEEWQKKAATALLNSGSRRLLAALTNCIAHGIPNLARASLSTAAWMSSFLHSTGDTNFQSMACSILIPQLLEISKYDNAQEERLLASFSLHRLIKISDYASMLPSVDNKVY